METKPDCQVTDQLNYKLNCKLAFSPTCKQYKIFMDYYKCCDYIVLLETKDNTVHCYSKVLKKCILSFRPEKIFLGETISKTLNKAQATDILFKIGPCQYVHCEKEILYFTTATEIIEYIPTKKINGFYTSSYAIDIELNYYLFNESAICQNLQSDNPHMEYIKSSTKLCSYFNIAYFTINGQVFTHVEFVINPEEYYNYLKSLLNLQDGEPLDMSYKTVSNEVKKLTKEDFINLIETYGKIIKCKKIPDLKIYVTKA